MMKTELEKSIFADLMIGRWRLRSYDDWKKTSWLLFGMAIMTDNSELAKELHFLESIADERARLEQ